jgi:hypothetical protein
VKDLKDFTELQAKLQSILDDIQSGKLDWKEGQRIIIADLQNELEALRKEYDAVIANGIDHPNQSGAV